jgi:hypothetical protein
VSGTQSGAADPGVAAAVGSDEFVLVSKVAPSVTGVAQVSTATGELSLRNHRLPGSTRSRHDHAL